MLTRIVVVCLSMIFLASCNNEQDDLAEAQACLDKVPESNPTEADACLAYVDKHDSQQAQILKCSIYMTSGGLVEAKIKKAYKALKDEDNNSQANKNALYMATLSLDLPDIDSAYTKAGLANAYCQKSGVPGLMFLSDAILIGTTMNKTLKNLTGSGIDLDDPAATQAAINGMLATCTDPLATPPDKEKCEAALPTMGATAANLAGTYCDSSSADQDVCASFNGAVEAAGGDTTKVGQALFCYLKDLHYNASTGECM